MPGDFGGPVCSCAFSLVGLAHGTAGAPCTRHSRAPFVFEGAEVNGKPRAVRAARLRTCVSLPALFHVFARSPCDEAIHSCSLACCAMDCFADARNDGFGSLKSNHVRAHHTPMSSSGLTGRSSHPKRQ